MGCTRNLTQEDFEQLKNSLNPSVVPDRQPSSHEKKSAENIVIAELNDIKDKNSATMRANSRETLHKVLPHLVKILEKPGTLEYAAVKDMLTTIFTTKRLVMTSKEELRLPDALHTLLKNHPNPLGLFKKTPEYRGRHSSAVDHHYEILSTAALIKKTHTSLTGKSLSISSVDRVDLGVKFPWRYAHKTKNTGERDTIEGDTLIHKSDGRKVAIDAKYSRHGNFNTTNGLQEELDGIRSNFRSGDFHEHFFITNHAFGPDFKEMILAENLKIAEDYVKISYENYRKVPVALLTTEEREALFKEGHRSLMEKPDRQIFKEHNDSFQKFVRDYNIDQIEICEFVTYPGT